MALPATDNFNTGIGEPSASWTQNHNGFNITASNNARGDNVADFNHMYWNADAFANDQYSQAKCTGNGFEGVGVRMSGGAGSHNGYYIICNQTGGTRLSKVVAGSVTNLIGPGSLADPVPSDILRIEVSGTSITVKYNGVTQTGTPLVDASLASGSAGLVTFGGGVLDDWEGGNLTAPPSSGGARRRRVLIGMAG